MAYVQVPKDLTSVKSKVMFNLTKRQLVCFGCGALVGLPLFFLLKDAGNSVATLCMMVVMLPFFMFGIYEKNGQPMEKVVGYFVQTTILRPKQRPYRTKNLYAALERQRQLNEEVHSIVQRHQKDVQKGIRKRTGAGVSVKADKSRAKAD